MSQNNIEDGDDEYSIATDTNISAVMWTDPLLPPSSQPRSTTRRRPRLIDKHAIRLVERDHARLNHPTTTTTFRRRLSQTLHFWWNDWFHTLAYQKTTTLIAYLFGTYMTLILTFAGLYYTLSHTVGCEMDLHGLMEALYFSLSTQATIGYGVSDYYFGGCWTPFGLVLFQVWTALLFDAVAIGLIFQRLSRGHKRGKTVWCSRVACVRRVAEHKWYLYIRMAEGRRHPLFQTHVKGYCVRHERHCSTSTTGSSSEVQTTHFVTRPMQWLESQVWMRLPQVIVHALDETSPLVPPKRGWCDAQGHWRSSAGTDTTLSSFEQSLQDYWHDRQLEFIVLLEGIDALTGSMSQTQHSYTVDDLVWQAQFVPCVRPSVDGGVVVDFSQFHETRPVPEEDETYCPYL